VSISRCLIWTNASYKRINLKACQNLSQQRLARANTAAGH